MIRAIGIMAFIVCWVFLLSAASVGAAGEYTLQLPLGLQEDALYIPSDNPLTPEKIALGKQLWFDPRLSRDNTVACASCHSSRFGFTDGQPVSTGIEGQKGGAVLPQW